MKQGKNVMHHENQDAIAGHQNEIERERQKKEHAESSQVMQADSVAGLSAQLEARGRDETFEDFKILFPAAQLNEAQLAKLYTVEGRDSVAAEIMAAKAQPTEGVAVIFGVDVVPQVGWQQAGDNSNSSSSSNSSSNSNSNSSTRGCASDRLMPEIPLEKVFDMRAGMPECVFCPDPAIPVVEPRRAGAGLEDSLLEHALIAATHLAFAEHRPLCLSPDHIWLAVTQGVSLHVNNNPETFRQVLGVKHSGSEQLMVEVGSEVWELRQSDSSFWESVVGQLVQQLHANLDAEPLEKLQATFTTTGTCEKIAGQVVLLDTVSQFFSYQVREICGIPSVTLDGTPSDWKLLSEKVKALSELKLGLEWWFPHLLRVVQEVKQRPSPDTGYPPSLTDLAALYVLDVPTPINSSSPCLTQLVIMFDLHSSLPLSLS